MGTLLFVLNGVYPGRTLALYDISPLEDVFSLCFASSYLAHIIGNDDYVMKYVRQLRFSADYSVWDAYLTGNMQMLWIKLKTRRRDFEPTNVLLRACQDDNAQVVEMVLQHGLCVKQPFGYDPLQRCIIYHSLNALNTLMCFCRNVAHTLYNLENEDSACSAMCRRLKFNWTNGYSSIIQKYTTEEFQELYNRFEGCELSTLMEHACAYGRFDIFKRCVELGGTFTTRMLRSACRGGWLEIVQLMHAKGMDLTGRIARKGCLDWANRASDVYDWLTVTLDSDNDQKKTAQRRRRRPRRIALTQNTNW